MLYLAIDKQRKKDGGVNLWSQFKTDKEVLLRIADYADWEKRDKT